MSRDRLWFDIEIESIIIDIYIDFDIFFFLFVNVIIIIINLPPGDKIQVNFFKYKNQGFRFFVRSCVRVRVCVAKMGRRKKRRVYQAEMKRRKKSFKMN